jgi:tetratricopeptide (TPR) repeat protein
MAKVCPREKAAGSEKASVAFFLLLMCVSCFSLFSSCVSHLKEAKVHYTQGQKYSRLYQTQDALGSFKRALEEAERVVSKRPSSQAYMLKGMTELKLKLWQDAEESFRLAHSHGFEKGEEWAQQVSLLGLALSLEELWVEDSSLRIYIFLIEKSKFSPVTVLAAQRYTDVMLKRALLLEGKEREKLLASVLKAVQKLSDGDLSCGFYHYLRSQILSHFSDYGESFESALMAKELGLPTEEILRDNDLQIVYCYQKLKEELSPEEWEDFRVKYMEWVKKWNWKGPEAPSWQKER